MSEAASTTPRSGSSARVTRGELTDLAMPELAQMLVLGLKTAHVRLTRGRRSGQIWFVAGAARHAVCGALKGEAAFYELVGWSRGSFTIEHEAECRDRTIENDTMFLLMESARRADEAARAPAEPEVVGVAVRTPRLRGWLVGAALTTLTAAGVLTVLGPGKAASPRQPVSPAAPTSAPNPFFEDLGVEASLVLAEPAKEPVPEPPVEVVEPVPTAESAALTPRESTPLPSADEAFPPLYPEVVYGPPAPGGFLQLRIRSHVKQGRLVLLVDGREILGRRLAARKRGVRLFRRMLGKPEQVFEETLAVAPGSHAIVARLERDAAIAHESAVDLTVGAERPTELDLSVGRRAGRPLVIEIVPPGSDDEETTDVATRAVD